MKRRNFLSALGGAFPNDWHLHPLFWLFLTAIGCVSAVAALFSGDDIFNIWLPVIFATVCLGFAVIIQKLDGD